MPSPSLQPVLASSFPARQGFFLASVGTLGLLSPAWSTRIWFVVLLVTVPLLSSTGPRRSIVLYSPCPNVMPSPSPQPVLSLWCASVVDSAPALPVRAPPTLVRDVGRSSSVLVCLVDSLP